MDMTKEKRCEVILYDWIFHCNNFRSAYERAGGF